MRDPVAEGMRQAAALRATMAQVAALLGYTLQPPVAVHLYRDAVRLRGPDGQALAVTRLRGAPGRLVIHGVYPHGPGVASALVPTQRITVALARGAPAIARDVQRRLLPRYRQHLALVQAAVRRHEQAVQAREAVVAELLATIPGMGRGTTSGDRVTLHFYRHGDIHGQIEVHGCGDTLALTLTGTASRLLPPFVAVLRDEREDASR